MLISKDPHVVTINVTPIHLLVADDETSPVGLAMMQRLPQIENVALDDDAVLWEHGGALWRYRLPDDVVEVIQDWRQGKSVGPFSLVMDNREAERV